MIPRFFDQARVGEVYRVRYEERAADAATYRAEHGVTPAVDDELRIGLLLIDVQNTFCIPGFELFVAGRSGHGAVDDNVRLSRFLYENLGRITQIHATLDTHVAMQIFHSQFLVDADGCHPAPMTPIALADVEAGKWRVSADAARTVAGADQDYLLHYCRTLSKAGRYELMVWPYHAMLGGIGHALVSAVEEAVFFHGQVRGSQPRFDIKGMHPLTENYSVLRPEVLSGPAGDPLAFANDALMDELLSYDVLIVCGQAKSHCLRSSVADLLDTIRQRDERLAGKVYLLEDCTSPVVVDGVVDYTEDADRAFAEFEAAGMHLVQSTDPIATWPHLPAPAVAERR